jgi:hypothetical protein
MLEIKISEIIKYNTPINTFQIFSQNEISTITQKTIQIKLFLQNQTQNKTNNLIATKCEDAREVCVLGTTQCAVILGKPPENDAYCSGQIL